MGTPWSPPAWMKTNGSLFGGELIPQLHGSFATYLKKFVEAYTVVYAPTGGPERGIVSVLADDGARTWTNTREPDTMRELLDTDCCGRRVAVAPPVEKAAPEVHLT